MSPKRSPIARASLKRGQARCRLAREQVTQGHRYHQETPLYAIVVAFVQEVLSTSDPAARQRHLTPRQVAKGQPEGTPCRPRRIALLQALLMGSGRQRGAHLVLTHEIGRHSQPFQVVDYQGSMAIGGRELGVRVMPRLPFERAATGGERVLHVPKALAPQPLSPPVWSARQPESPEAVTPARAQRDLT